MNFMKKKVFYTELAYILGVFTLAFGTALTEKGGFGLSMVVAPAYILHLKISEFLPFFTFGMAEYTFQAAVLLLMVLVLRKAKLTYLFSFVTAVLYSLMLDGMITLLSFITVDGLVFRIVMYALGMVICTLGVALVFNTYIPQAAYEMFVKEITDHFGIALHKFKLAYDYVSCGIAILLSFAFFGFGQFHGIGWGTVAGTFVNGLLINMWNNFLHKHRTFADGMPWRKFFNR